MTSFLIRSLLIFIVFDEYLEQIKEVFNLSQILTLLNNETKQFHKMYYTTKISQRISKYVIKFVKNY